MKFSHVVMSFGMTAALLVGAAVPVMSSAQVTTQIRSGLEAAAGPSGYTAGSTEKDLTKIVGRVIFVFLSLFGTIFLLLLVYAGFLWMTAMESKQVDKAKEIIKNTVVGLLVVVAAYAVANFVLTQISDQVLKDTSSGAASTSPPSK